MTMPFIGVRIPAAAKATLQSRAEAAGVTLATYAAAVLVRHLADPPLADVAARPSGLTAASEKTRKRVSRAGVKSRGNKESDRG